MRGSRSEQKHIADASFTSWPTHDLLDSIYHGRTHCRGVAAQNKGNPKSRLKRPNMVKRSHLWVGYSLHAFWSGQQTRMLITSLLNVLIATPGGLNSYPTLFVNMLNQGLDSMASVIQLLHFENEFALQPDPDISRQPKVPLPRHMHTRAHAHARTPCRNFWL